MADEHALKSSLSTYEALCFRGVREKHLVDPTR